MKTILLLAIIKFISIYTIGEGIPSNLFPTLHKPAAFCRARLSKKNLGASWPPHFHIWLPGEVF